MSRWVYVGTPDTSSSVYIETWTKKKRVFGVKTVRSGVSVTLTTEENSERQTGRPTPRLERSSKEKSTPNKRHFAMVDGRLKAHQQPVPRKSYEGDRSVESQSQGKND